MRVLTNSYFLYLLLFSFSICISYKKNEDLEYHEPVDLLSFDKIIKREYLSDNLPVLTAVLFTEKINFTDFLVQQFKLTQQELDFIDLVVVDLSLNNLSQLRHRYNLDCSQFSKLNKLPVICLFKDRNILPTRLTGFSDTAQIVKFIKQQLGRELRQLEQRYLKSAETKLNSNPTYKSKISGYPHYYPQPYLGGLHAFGTPYRMDFFYPYYGPKFRLY